MKDLKNNLSVIILCIFEIAVGVLLLINPLGFTQAIIVTAGAALTITGLVSAFKYFKTDIAEAAMGQNLTIGLLALFAGIFIIVRSEWIMKIILPALAVIFGILVLITGLSKIQFTCDLLRCKNKKWFLALINALISVICAILIINHPIAMDAIIWIFTGVVLIAEAVLDIITLIFTKNDSAQSDEEDDDEEKSKDSKDSKD